MTKGCRNQFPKQKGFIFFSLCFLSYSSPFGGREAEMGKGRVSGASFPYSAAYKIGNKSRTTNKYLQKQTLTINVGGALLLNRPSIE